MIKTAQMYLEIEQIPICAPKRPRYIVPITVATFLFTTQVSIATRGRLNVYIRKRRSITVSIKKVRTI